MVRLRYVYADGHTHTTHPMLRSEAERHMVTVGAVATTPTRWSAAFGYIEFVEV